MSYSKEERETLVRTDALLDHWIIDTTESTSCSRIRKLKGVVIISEELTNSGTVIAGQYLLPKKCVSFRNHKEKPMKTEVERKKTSQRMIAMHANRRKLKELQNAKNI